MPAHRDAPARRPDTRARLWGFIAAIIGAAVGGPVGAAAITPVVVHESSVLSISVGPAGQPMIAGVAGQIWRLDPNGAPALPLSPPGQFAERPQLSPDGQWILYQALRDGYFHVAVMDLRGTQTRQLTSGDFNDISPSWAPDGQHVVLASDRGGDFGLWELDLNTLAVHQLTVDPGDELDPAWDPAGQRLAFVAEHGAASGLYVREISGSATRLVARGSGLRAPSWRPDGSVIMFVAVDPSSAQLMMAILSDPPVVKVATRREAALPVPAAWIDRTQFLYPADGHIKRLEFGSSLATEIPFSASLTVTPRQPAPHVAAGLPQGAQAIRGLRGLAALPNGHLVISALGDLWELTGDGGVVRRLTNDAYLDEDPAASPDGSQLAFTSDRNGRRQIWLLDLVSGASHAVTNEPAFAIHPVWSPRSGRLAYLAGMDDPQKSLGLRVAEVDRAAATTLALNLPGSGTPAWSPDGSQVVVIAPAGSGGIAGPPRLLSYAADGSGMARRTTLVSEAVGPGANHLAWSADGGSIAVASSSGLTLLPVSSEGLVGADWRRLAPERAAAVQWAVGDQALWFIGNGGLTRVVTGGDPIQVVAVALTMPAPPLPGRSVIRAGRVFDGSAVNYQYNQDIVMDAGRIVAVRPWNDLEPAEHVIDARTRTVIPGLIDTLLATDGFSAAQLGPILLAFGITTAQSASYDFGAVQETSEIWQAHQAGPRLFASETICTQRTSATPVANPSADSGTAALRVCTPLMLSGATWTSNGNRERPIWSNHWLPAVRGGIDAVEAGAPAPGTTGSLASGFPLYQDGIEVMVRSGAMLIPAFVTRAAPLVFRDRPELFHSPLYEALYSPADRDLLAQSLRLMLERQGPELRRWLRDHQRAAARILAAGGSVASASGTSNLPPGLSLHAELLLLADAGFSPAQVLRSTTHDAARALGLDEQVGAIAPGRLADLLIVNGDPLRDLADLQKIEAVVTHGRLQPTRDLLAQAAAALEKFTGQSSYAAGESSLSAAARAGARSGAARRSARPAHATAARNSRTASQRTSAKPQH